VVGLDLEAGSVAATEVRGDGGVEVVTTGVVPLEPGAFHEGEVADPEALAAALRALFSEHKLGKTVRLGIANQRVSVRTMEIPDIDDPKELESAVRFQAQEHVPMPLDQAVFDYQVVGHTEGEQGRKLAVVAVAARRDMLERFMDALRRGGVRPAGIDLSAFGMLRALATGTNGGPSPQTPGGQPAKLYCNLGDVTNLAVASGRTCLFTRISTFGVEEIAERLAERRGIAIEDARAWLGRVGLEGPTEKIDGDPETVEAARGALAEGAAKLANELRLSLDFYGTQAGAVPIQGVIACGPGTTIPGLVERLHQELGQPFEVGRPAQLDGLEPAAAARLTVAYGLGLGE